MKYTIGARTIDLSRVTHAEESELPFLFNNYDDTQQKLMLSRREYTFIIGSRDFTFYGPSGAKLYEIYKSTSTTL